MSHDNEERRPRQESGVQTPAKKSLTILPDPTDIQRLARRHDYAVLVVAQRRDGVVLSQVFTHLASAEKKVQRTRERRLFASMTLVRIVPAPVAIAEDFHLVVGEAL